MPKVLISDKLSPDAARIFKERGVDVDEKVGMTPDELIACIGDYDGLAVRSSTKVTEKVLAAATQLKVIGRAGIGVDNIDVPAATARGVIVMNTPFGNSITTAEHAIAMMFSLARQIPAADASTHAGKWEKSRFMGVEVYGKTLGLIGCGNIGSIVADRALGLKMKVVAYDPYLSPDRAADLGVEKVELEELFARADFITLHTPLTEATRNIIDKDAIAAMRDGVRKTSCSALTASSRRRISVRPPARRRKTLPSRLPSKWPTTSRSAPSPTPSICRRSAPRMRRSCGLISNWPSRSAAFWGSSSIPA